MSIRPTPVLLSPALPSSRPSGAPVAPASSHAEALPSEPPGVDTPYQKIRNSAPGRFVRENKVVSALAGAGGWIVMAGGASQSPAFEQFARYGIVPAIGAGVALVGAAAVHDAFVNDLGVHDGRALAKIAVGSGSALGGTEMVGRTFDIPVLNRALSGTLETLGDHGQALAGVAVAGSGLLAGQFALDRFSAAAQQDEHRAANILLGTAGSGAAVGGVLGGLELVGRQYGIAGLDRAFSGTLETLARTGAGAVGAGGFLTAGSAVLAHEAVNNIRAGGNSLITAVEGMGAVTTGLGGAELVGHGLGISALDGLFTQNMGLIGAGGLSAAGAAITTEAARSMTARGLTLGNTSAATAGATMTVGGSGLAALILGFDSTAYTLARGTAVAAGAGLLGVTAALGRTSIDSFRKGDVATGLAAAAGTTVTASGGLGLVGHGLGIEAVSRVGDQLFEHALLPAYDRVLVPAARFLFENPVVGGIALAVGVGAYAWVRLRQKPDGAADAQG